MDFTKTILFIFMLLGFSRSFSFDRLWLTHEVGYPLAFREDSFLDKQIKKMGDNLYGSPLYDELVPKLIKAIDIQLSNPKVCDTQVFYDFFKFADSKNVKTKQLKGLLKSLQLTRRYDSVVYNSLMMNLKFYNEVKSSKIIEKIKPNKKISKEKTSLYFTEFDGKSLCSTVSSLKDPFKKFKKAKQKKKKFIKIAEQATLQKLLTNTNLSIIKSWINAELFQSTLELKNYAQNMDELKNSHLALRAESLAKYKRKMSTDYPNYVPEECRIDRPNRLGPVEKSKEVHQNTKRFILNKVDGQFRRARLYLRYTPEQINELAMVIHRASKRLEADCVSIVFDYDVFKVGDEDTLVLSPQDQYNLMLRLLKKDFMRLRQKYSLSKIEMSYEDIAMAAYETGLIQLSELDEVIGFEEFWNKKEPKWKKWASFTLSIGQTASLALPPPANFIVATGLILLNTTLFKPKKEKTKDENSEALF